MPIIIKDILWKQTEQVLTIKVPSRGTPSTKIDLFYSKGYMKASYDQFFFEALLFDEIDVTRSNCTVTPDHIVFELTKIDRKPWDSLERTVTKPERMKLKLRYIEEEQKRLREESTKKIEKNAELKRVAVREQIVLDYRQREALEEVKKNEKDKALEELKLVSKGRNKRQIKSKQFHIENSNVKSKEIAEIPALRSNDTVYVDFTSREFPTPSRESRLEEENDWLRKQSECRRSVGFAGEDLRPEERNPQFLKSKGDEFTKMRNHLGAISAYTFGIKLNNTFSDLYAARAEAHFLQGNFGKSAQDCTKALELMKPEVPQNLAERAKCIGRRGVCLNKLGLALQAVGELKASLKLAPNEEFEEELEKIQAALENQDE